MVDFNDRTVRVREKGKAALAVPRREWQVLALHYLAARGVREPVRWVSFPELEPAAQVYNSVYRGRVINRFVATAGRGRNEFETAANALGGEPVEWGDAGFRFQVFPRLPVAVAWYAGDDEFPPDASFVYPDNITAIFSLEDVVVLSERIVARLQDGAW